MAIVKFVLSLCGIAAMLVGLLWIGQGTGYVHWPETSFMIGHPQWATRGLMLAVAGAAIILISRRMGD
ncbi:MAG TPA: hypothetical protein VLK25_02745 [Allosphingosinicella sp.]|nr:hypothetical protein [Allosphingosinicella sp.]